MNLITPVIARWDDPTPSIIRMVLLVIFSVVFGITKRVISSRKNK